MQSVDVLRREVKQYIDQSDERMVRMVYAMLAADQENDWEERISDDERASIERGIKDMEAGRVIPHEEMKAYYSKWLTK